MYFTTTVVFDMNNVVGRDTYLTQFILIMVLLLVWFLCIDNWEIMAQSRRGCEISKYVFVWPGLKPGRRLLKTHLSPIGRQMAIKNSVSSNFYLCWSIVLTFSIAPYPVGSLTTSSNCSNTVLMVTQAHDLSHLGLIQAADSSGYFK